MCFGVRDAIAWAGKVAETGPVTVLGELVHNPTVLESLRRKGIRVVEKPEAETLEPGSTYLVTAHGVSDAQREIWQRSGAKLYDTTCPLVRKAHERLREFVEAGVHPVVIGKWGHVEVRGLIGDYPAATVIETESDIERLPQGKALGVVAQTTQPVDVVRDLIWRIQAARPAQKLFFADTICKPTKDRQQALRELCAEVELMVVVGGRHSNNTRQLVSAAKDCGVSAFHVEQPDDLRPEWFRGIERVGLTAGTSTPPQVIDAVEAAIYQIGKQMLSEQERELAAPSSKKGLLHLQQDHS
jgi:4-hydroxy-3-methylbut-2-enyl diphosphate reductase